MFKWNFHQTSSNQMIYLEIMRTTNLKHPGKSSSYIWYNIINSKKNYDGVSLTKTTDKQERKQIYNRSLTDLYGLQIFDKEWVILMLSVGTL